MTTAREAAERIIPQHITGTGAAKDRLAIVEQNTAWAEKIIQEAINAEASDTCQLISDMLRERIEIERLWHEASRKANAAQEAARQIGRQAGGIHCRKYNVDRYPWLLDKEPTP